MSPIDDNDLSKADVHQRPIVAGLSRPIAPAKSGGATEPQPTSPAMGKLSDRYGFSPSGLAKKAGSGLELSHFRGIGWVTR